MNYKFSFSVRPDGAKKSTIPNMYQLTNEFQQLLLKYNLKVDGYLFEHNKFQSFFLKKISALVSPTAQESIVPVQVYSCGNCGHINRKLNPTLEQGEEDDN